MEEVSRHRNISMEAARQKQDLEIAFNDKCSELDSVCDAVDVQWR
jgi:hypothetical protein